MFVSVFYFVSVGDGFIRPDLPQELLEDLGKELEEGKEETPDLKAVMEKYSYFTYLLPRAYFHELKKQGKRRYIFCFNL